MMYKFWMVVNVSRRSESRHATDGWVGEQIPKSDTPTFLHASEESAYNEAFRLAKRYGPDFVVLEAVGVTTEMPLKGEFKLTELLPE